jgi:hypothetical protein
MTRTRASAALAIVTAMAGSALSVTLATPIAHADALDPIKDTVSRDRLIRGPGCDTLKYNGQLEDVAQRYARSSEPSGGGVNGLKEATADAQGVNYNGDIRAFKGFDDPQAAATTRAYEVGAGNLIGDCDFTEFGVGFIRYEDMEVDVVAIVLGKPNAAPPPEPAPAEVPAPVENPNPVAPNPGEVPKQGPTVDADPGVLGVTFHITDRSGVASQCTYASEGFETTTFDLPANGSFDLFVAAIRLFKNRTGKVTCDNGTSTPTSVFF